MTDNPIRVTPMPVIDEPGTRGASSGLPPAEAAKMAGWLVADGKITQAQAAEALAADGFAPPTAPEAEADLSDAAGEIDAAFPVPESSTAYRLPPLDESAFQSPAQMREADTRLRTWLHTAQLPATVGTYLAGEIARVAKDYEKMDPGARTLHRQREEAQLGRVLGPNAGERIAAARRLVQEIEAKQPGLVHFLETTGAGNSAFVVAQLATHAERLAARRK